MDEVKGTQRDSQAEPQEKSQAQPPTVSTELAEPSTSTPSQDAAWVRASTSQVMRTVAVALLTAALVLGALFLLWQVRTFIGWFVIALFMAAVLNPLVNWLQRRHRLMKRSLCILLTYIGLLVAMLFVVGIFIPVLVDQIQGLTNFIASAAKAPEGPTAYIKGLAEQNGLGGLFKQFSDQLDNVRTQLADLLRNLFASSGAIFSSIAGAVVSLLTILTLTFFLLLGSERYLNAGVGLFSDTHQPLVRRLLTQSGGAISGYVSGNLAVSLICGVTTFIVLLVLGMPYAAPLALLVALLDLVPLVGATIGGAVLVVVGLFVEPWKALVLLVFVLIYQQVESNVLQPVVYSKAVQLNGLAILIALMIGAQLLGIVGALLAIPVAEIIRIVVTEVLAYRRTSREANEPAVASASPPTASD